MDRRNVPRNALRFEAPVRFAAGDDGGKPRRFSGTAYSGKPITGHWFWGKVVFDLDTVELPERLPALVGHDRDKIAGYADDFEVSRESGIRVSGPLTRSGEWGSRVAEMSDEGFPWQMSVHIDPDTIEEVAAGKAVEVNGRQFQGPGFIFRNSRIREVSFTPTGWDGNTSAVAMGDQGQGEVPVQFSNAAGADGMTFEELQKQFQQAQSDLQAAQQAKTDAEARAQAAEERAKEAEEKARQYSERLEAERAERRKADVQQLFSDLGREFTEDAAKPYLDMSAEVFEQVAKDLRARLPQAPEGAFSDTATEGDDGGRDADGYTADDRKAIEFAAGL